MLKTPPLKLVSLQKGEQVVNTLDEANYVKIQVGKGKTKEFHTVHKNTTPEEQLKQGPDLEPLPEGFRAK